MCPAPRGSWLRVSVLLCGDGSGRLSGDLCTALVAAFSRLCEGTAGNWSPPS